MPYRADHVGRAVGEVRPPVVVVLERAVSDGHEIHLVVYPALRGEPGRAEPGRLVLRVDLDTTPQWRVAVGMDAGEWTDVGRCGDHSELVAELSLQGGD